MKRVLYLGLRKPPNKEGWIHFPVIHVEPLKLESGEVTSLVDESDWILFTSQTSVEFLLNLVEKRFFSTKVIFSIGEITAKALRNKGLHVDFIPHEETQEGMISLFKTFSLKNKKIFCGRSSLSRPEIKNYLDNEGCLFTDPVLYETKVCFDNALRPPLHEIDEVIFTSPSTVEGFREAYRGETLPKDLILTPIGPVTERKMHDILTLNPLSSNTTLKY